MIDPYLQAQLIKRGAFDRLKSLHALDENTSLARNLIRTAISPFKKISNYEKKSVSKAFNTWGLGKPTQPTPIQTYKKPTNLLQTLYNKNNRVKSILERAAEKTALQTRNFMLGTLKAPAYYAKDLGDIFGLTYGEIKKQADKANGKNVSNQPDYFLDLSAKNLLENASVVPTKKPYTMDEARRALVSGDKMAWASAIGNMVWKLLPFATVAKSIMGEMPPIEGKAISELSREQVYNYMLEKAGGKPNWTEPLKPEQRFILDNIDTQELADTIKNSKLSKKAKLYRLKKTWAKKLTQDIELIKQNPDKLLELGRFNKDLVNDIKKVLSDNPEHLIRASVPQIEAPLYARKEAGFAKLPEFTPDEYKQIKKILRGTKGRTAEDIMKTYPNIQLKRNVQAKDIHGNKITIDEGEKLTPYELKGNKILLQDGQTYIVSKNQFQNIKGNSIVAEGKPFAPELKGLEESLGKEKYKSYTLPGGKDYKEILIKAPSKPLKGELPTGKIIKPINGENYLASEAYKSPHWDEPNVLAHLRMNTRTYKGKRVSFLEELQSDWEKSLRAGGDVPKHELLKNWQEWSIKRALKEAVDSGAKYFAWINGEQTSARYNLATHLDNVKWNKTRATSKVKGIDIDLIPKQGDPINIITDKKGVIRISDKGNLEGKKLDEVLGKGLADKIMSKDKGTLSGEGLKFGGEWAHNLYDKQVPNIVKKLTGAPIIKMDMNLPIKNVKNNWYIVGKPNETLKIEDLKVGEIINNGNIGDYIITDVIGDGKFKAVPALIARQFKGDPFLYGLSDAEIINKKISKIRKNNLEETFDISNPTTIQQGIKLTPEVVAKIKGEAPVIKTSGKMSEEPKSESKVTDYENNTNEKNIYIGKNAKTFNKNKLVSKYGVNNTNEIKFDGSLRGNLGEILMRDFEIVKRLHIKKGFKNADNEEVNERINKIAFKLNKINFKLGDVLSMPKLFEAYPQLKSMRVFFENNLLKEEYGNYQDNKIHINLFYLKRDYYKDPSVSFKNKILDTLRHEIQHKIQKIESWPRGGSLASIDIPSVQLQILLNQRKNLLSNPKYRKYTSLEDMLYLDKLINKTKKGVKLSPDEMRKVFGNDNELSKTAFKVYRNIVGEKQADNFASKHNYKIIGLKYNNAQKVPIKSQIKRVIGEPSKLVTKREYILLKEKIRNIARGFREGKKFTKTEIKQNQKEIINLLDNSELEAQDKVKFIKAIKNVQTTEQLQKAIPKIQEKIKTLEEKFEKKSLLNQIKKELKEPLFRKVGSRKVSKYSPETTKLLQSFKETESFKNPESLTYKKLEAVSDWFEKHPQEEIPDKLLNKLDELNRRHLTLLSVNELKKQLKSIRLIKKTGKTFNQLKRERIKRQRQEIINEFKKIISADNDKPVLPENKGLIENLLNKASLYNLNMLNSDVLFDILDEASGVKKNEGKIHNYFQNLFNKARDLDIQLNNKDFNDIKNKMNELKISNLHKIEKVKLRGVTHKLTHNQILDIYISSHDKAKLNSMLEGNKFTPDFIKDAIGKLSKNEIAFGDFILSIYERKYNDINPVFREEFFMDMPKNKGYSSMNKDINYINKDLDLIQQSKEYALASVPKGMTKKRSGSLAPIKLDAIGNLTDHLQKSNFYVAFELPIKEVNAVLRGIREDIINKYGVDYANVLDELIKRIAKNGAFDKTKLEKFLLHTRTGFTKSLLGNLVTPLKQTISLFSFLTEISEKDLIKGISSYWTHKGKWDKFWLKNTPQIKNRAETLTRDIADIGKSRSAYKKLKGKKNTSEVTLSGVRFFDKLTVRSGATAVYLKYRRMGLSKEESIKKVLGVVRRTQPTGDIKDLSLLQSGSALEKLLTMFMNQPNKYYNILYQTARAYSKGRASKGELLRAIIYAWIIPAILYEEFSTGFKAKKKDLLKAVALGPASYTLVLGNVFQAVRSGFDYTATPIESLAQDLTSTFKYLAKGELTKAISKSLRLTAEYKGIPINQPKRSLEGIKDLTTGKTKDWRRLIWSKRALGDKNQAQLETLYQAYKKNGSKMLRGIDKKTITQFKKYYRDKISGITEDEKEIRNKRVEERARIVIKKIKKLSPSERKKFIKDWTAKRIITKQVYAEMLKILKGE